MPCRGAAHAGKMRARHACGTASIPSPGSCGWCHQPAAQARTRPGAPSSPVQLPGASRLRALPAPPVPESSPPPHGAPRAIAAFNSLIACHAHAPPCPCAALTLAELPPPAESGSSRCDDVSRRYAPACALTSRVRASKPASHSCRAPRWRVRAQTSSVVAHPRSTIRAHKQHPHHASDFS